MPRSRRPSHCPLAALLLLGFLAAAASRPLAPRKPEPPAADSPGTRRLVLPFSVGGDSGFLFNRQLLPLLVAEGMTDLNDSEQRAKMAENDTAGKYYRTATDEYCCLLRCDTKTVSYLLMAKLLPAASSTVLLTSDSFLTFAERYRKEWRTRFCRLGPELAVCSEGHGSGYSDDRLLLLNPVTLNADELLLPIDAWNSFGAGYQSAYCAIRATDTSIDCECQLRGDSKWRKRRSGDWKPNRRKVVRLPYRLRGNRWLLTDSSGSAVLNDAQLFL